ncbi:nucleotidyltransferase domain-containing protein [Desulfobacca acetoxidans]
MALWEKSSAAELQLTGTGPTAFTGTGRTGIASFFSEKTGKKVYLTGSLLRAEYFYPFSDIDLAVEGLQEDYL